MNESVFVTVLDQERSDREALFAWAQSGLMLLTGPPKEPLLPTRDYIARIDALCRALSFHAAHLGGGVVPSISLLTERAALLGLRRGGSQSAGRRSRIVQAADGYIAVTLARAEDIELLPAWLGCDPDDLPWDAVARKAQRTPARELEESARHLGLPVARIRAPSRNAAPVRLYRHARPRDACARSRSPLVVDLSSLWAGPLCGHLLGQAGARVIKVESVARPDGARRGNATFFDLLHGGQEMLALDFRSPGSIARLRELIRRADIVIEASRPRALEHLGLSADDCFSDNPTLTWISITAYGRRGGDANAVGFGDDVAAAAGLVAHGESGYPSFVGDALADPITGLAAAAGGLAAHANGGGWLVDAAMFDAAAFVASARELDPSGAAVRPYGNEWILTFDGEAKVLAAPKARAPQRRAAGVGTHTAALLRELT